MNHTFRTSLIASGISAVTVLGCNSILDNQPGLPVAVVAEVATLPDAGTVPGCPAGTQPCFGSCVAMIDPLYGCGDPSCAPCASTRSTMGCEGRKCVVTGCDPGYSDCRANAADGCETDLSKATSCGACNAVCGAAAPLCAPVGGSHQCTNGCTPSAPLNCGAECVDPSTSPSHCGACNKACPAIANGTAVCAAGTCGLTCKPRFHACAGACAASTDPARCGPACAACPVAPGGVATCVNDVCGVECPPTAHACAGKCIAKTDPTACGVACTACPVAPNAAAICTADACGFTCSVGFGNCDANAVNGCETNLATSPAHCGACTKACNAGQTCVNSVCV
jgi:hypothetical protein